MQGVRTGQPDERSAREPDNPAWQTSAGWTNTHQFGPAYDGKAWERHGWSTRWSPTPLNINLGYRISRRLQRWETEIISRCPHRNDGGLTFEMVE